MDEIRVSELSDEDLVRLMYEVLGEVEARILYGKESMTRRISDEQMGMDCAGGHPGSADYRDVYHRRAGSAEMEGRG